MMVYSSAFAWACSLKKYFGDSSDKTKYLQLCVVGCNTLCSSGCLLYYRIHHSKQSCQRFDSISLMVLVQRPWTCSKESLTSLKRLRLFLGHCFLFQRKNEELVSGGSILVYKFNLEITVSAC